MERNNYAYAWCSIESMGMVCFHGYIVYTDIVYGYCMDIIIM